MPPANTPRENTTPERLAREAQHGQTSPRSSTPLSYLSAPVPDYAASLFTRSSDAADEANTAFLRESLSSLSASQPSRTTNVDHSRDPRLGLSRRPPNTSTRGTSPAQRDRLQRYLSYLYSMHHPPAPVAAAYSNRTPSPTRQSIYDWAPAADLLSDGVETTEQSHSRRREDHVDTGTEARYTRREGQVETATEPELLRNSVSHARGPTRQQESRSAPYVPHQEGGHNATERMLRYFMERERSGLSEEEERARGTGWYRPNPTRAAVNTENWYTAGREDSWSATAQRHNETSERNQQERVDAFRREYLASSGATPQETTRPPRNRSRAAMPGSTLLESAVKYLNGLRSSDSYDDALGAAIDLNLTTKDIFTSKHDEFILDIEELDTVHKTSWIQPGAVFEGHQYAASAVLPGIRHSSIEQINPNYRSRAIDILASSPTRSHGTALAANGTLMSRLATATFDNWPVRMVIHTIDTERMTLQGTMEAYDVPQHPLSLEIIRSGVIPKAGKKDAPITTYVEGHIIDFRNHSFLTPSTDQRRASHSKGMTETNIFPLATAAKDIENWRRLPPFNEHSDDEMADMLLSKDRLNALNRDFVFMRWKERCFVHGKNDTCSESERRTDHDRGHGLTISGFYYVSMRRSDGSIEGLYYDPHSTPYQHLRLKGTRAMWPAWKFR